MSNIIQKYFDDKISLDDNYSQVEIITIMWLNFINDIKLHEFISEYSDTKFYQKIRKHIKCSEKMAFLSNISNPSIDGISDASLNDMIEAIYDKQAHVFKKYLPITLHDIIYQNSDSPAYVFMLNTDIDIYKYMCQGRMIRYCNSTKNYYVDYGELPILYLGKYYFMKTSSATSVGECKYSKYRGVYIDNKIPFNHKDSIDVYEFDTRDEALNAQYTYHLDIEKFNRLYEKNAIIRT